MDYWKFCINQITQEKRQRDFMEINEINDIEWQDNRYLHKGHHFLFLKYHQDEDCTQDKII